MGQTKGEAKNRIVEFTKTSKTFLKGTKAACTNTCILVRPLKNNFRPRLSNRGYKMIVNSKLMVAKCKICPVLLKAH